MRTVLVVDDKELMRDSVGTTLQRAGFDVQFAEDGQKALEAIAAKRPDVVVSDLRMPGLTGLELLEKVRQIDDELPVLLMTAFGTIETAVQAMKGGAFDYLTKPFEGDELIIAVKRAIEHRRVMRENAILLANTSATSATTDSLSSGGPIETPRRGLARLIGRSGPMQKLKSSIEAIAASQGTVLITGESGVGKEVIARTVHELSPRSGGPFLAVNCAALSESLLESELFGHEKGAFTGAEKLRKGRFELADGGTLLLDEISEVSPKIQAKLLRVLQERQFERVGSSLAIGVDVRVVATSNRDLPGAVTAGEFRQDLYFRLNVLPINAMPLRERPDDVPDLAMHFVTEVCRREGRPIMAIAPGAIELMKAYTWPGNVRELQNICERAVVIGAGQHATVIGRELIEPWLTTQAPVIVRAAVNGTHATPASHAMTNGVMIEHKTVGATGSVVRTLEEIERETIVETLQRFSGHRQKTAAALGIGVRTLGLKLKKWKELKLVSEAL